MPNLIIVHGTGGSPESNWFPWLKRELEQRGCKGYVPRFPTPEGQNLNNWLSAFKHYEKYLDEDAIVVGHSLGPLFLLSVIERLNHPIKAAFFVAGFTGLLNNPEFDDLIRTFTEKGFDWEKIRSNCRKFCVISSDNDPYVPLAKGEELAKNLKAEFVVVKGGGHLNQGAGFTSFDLLLRLVESEI